MKIANNNHTKTVKVDFRDLNEYLVMAYNIVRIFKTTRLKLLKCRYTFKYKH